MLSHMLRAGRLGTCFSNPLHISVCGLQVLKHADQHTLCNEVNILSHFTSEHLSYLFGVCTSKWAITTNLQRFQDVSVTLHCVLLLTDHILTGNVYIYRLQSMELHVKVFNNVKSDNIVHAPKVRIFYDFILTCRY